MIKQGLVSKLAGRGSHFGYIIVFASLCIMVVVWAVYYAFGAFFNPVLEEFGWSRAMTSGAFSISMVTYGLLGVISGSLNDKFGSRAVMSICGFFLGLGYILMARISAIWQFYLIYGLLIAIGTSGSFVPLTSTVTRWFIKRRGMMTGIVVAGIGLGMFIGPPVATWLISSYHWQTAYIILGSAILVTVILAAQILRRDPAQVGQLPYGMEKEQESLLKKETSSVSLQQVIRTRHFWMAWLMFVCFGYCLHTVTVHIVPHAIELGINSANAAAVLSIVGASSIIGKIFMGAAIDRVGSKRVFIIRLFLMTADLFWLISIRDISAIYVFAALFGIAYGGCASAMSIVAAMLFGVSSHGLFLGVINLGVNLGGSIGPLMAGYIFDQTSSYQLAFLVASIIGVVGLILALFLKPLIVSEAG